MVARQLVRLGLAVSLVVTTLLVSQPADAGSGASEPSSDIARPKVRVVKGEEAEYYKDEWAGGVGKVGKFRFVDHKTTDLDVFEYSFDNPDRYLSVGQSDGVSSKVAFEPGRAGEHRLYVRSRDTSGDVGKRRTYRFYVSYVDEAVRWTFNEPAGSKVVLDIEPEGGNVDLALSGRFKWVYGAGGGTIENPGAVRFKGDHRTTAAAAAAAVDTEESFTVVGFARLTDLSATRVLVSQAGKHTSAFNLGYVADDPSCPTAPNGCWAFWMPHHDRTGAPPVTIVRSDQVVTSGQWMMIAGAYDVDGSAGEPKPTLHIYTCDAQGDLIDPEVEPAVHARKWDWPAVDTTRVGGTYRDDAVSDWWKGDVDQVRIFSGALGPDKLDNICLGGTMQALP